jgi:RNA polymerase sigma factor (sigma-70 family)
MSAHVPEILRLVADNDTHLLGQAQAYLRCRLERRAPGPELVEAWNAFYRTYSPLIRRFAVHCRVPDAALDDCLQQVWTELLSKLVTFCYEPQRGHFRSWLYALVRRRAIDLLRCRSRHATERLAEAGEAALAAPDGDPAAEYERRCRRGAVHWVLTELRRRVSARSYAMLRMRWMEEHSVQHTAISLGSTPQQVWSREHRAKRQFQRLFVLYARTKCGIQGPADGSEENLDFL